MRPFAKTAHHDRGTDAMTYDDLIAYAPLALFAQNRDTVVEMPNIVRRAQDYLVKRVDHDFFKTELAVTSVDLDGLIYADEPPEGLLEYRSVAVEQAPGRWAPLLRRSQDMLDSLFSGSRSGIPRYYAMTASMALRVYPRPPQVIAARITANIKPPTLAPGVQINKLTVEFPELMELAATHEAAVFNLDQNSIAVYAGRLQDALVTANMQISRRTRDESAQRPVETRNVTGE